MKKSLILAAAAIAALSACTKEIELTPINDSKAPIFTATIEPETKTQLVEGTTPGELTKVNWLSTDKVNVHGAVYTVTPGDPATTATLTKESGTAPEAIDGKYYAVYPSSIAFNTSTKTITLPATQTYDATTNGIGNVPMVAVNETTELQFKNICAVLAIKVESGTVKAIKVMADKKNLSGDFTLDPSTSAIAATTTGSNTVVLECDTSVTANNTTFYIAIPPQEYSSLQIYLSADGTTYKEAMATKKAAGLGTLSRNKIFPITYAKNAVQLWADGPYFALFNVGATITDYSKANVVANVLSESDFSDLFDYIIYLQSTEYKEELAKQYNEANIGGYFTWGGSTAKANDYYTGSDFDSNNLKPENDTATKLWGSAWRMPASSEFEALVLSSNTTQTQLTGETGSQYVTDCTLPGCKYEGIGSYSGISVFFPSAGYYDNYNNGVSCFGTEGPYWSSTNNESNRSWYLDVKTQNVYHANKDNNYLVRPVLATPAAAPAVTPDPTPAPVSNLLTGEFSVSATKKVQFTKANLYWDGSAYQFEANQTAYPTDWNTSHVGLFFWNSYDEYITTKIGYKPYYSSYGNLSSRSTSDVFWCGEGHPLEVAGTHGLYVLSAEEWYYLTGMYTFASYSDVRSDAYRFALAMVNGKAGLLIFPDGYTETTSGTGIAEVNNDYTAYPTESIPTNTWSAMEAAGVVFLPAAGYRGEHNGQTISPDYCQYWSSTPYDNSSAKDEEYAYGLFGTDAGDFKCPGKIQRKYGSSIRLVKTVE